MSPELRNTANYFITKSAEEQKPIALVHLLKLCYIAYGWHLEMYKKPLFPDHIEAWEYGPVIVNLYHEARKFTNSDGYLTRTL